MGHASGRGSGSARASLGRRGRAVDTIVRMNLDTLRTRLVALGLPKVDEVLSCAKAATHLKPSSGVDEASTESRIGGLPLIPSGASWPRADTGAPLSFVVQLRLDPLHGAATVLGLPITGMLSFFYDMCGQPWGFDPADRGSFAVVYTEDPDSVQAAPFPNDLADDFRIDPVALKPEPTVTLPSPLDRTFPRNLLSEEEDDAWADALTEIAEALRWGDRTILGGHPHILQGDMRIECEMVARGGVNAGSPEGYDDPRIEEWKKGAGEWVHLLQIASHEDAGLMWGDLGCLYYWMRKDDLEAGRFGKAWLILQCY